MRWPVMRFAYSFSVTLLTDLAALKLMRNQVPGLLLLASRRVDALSSLDMAAVRELPDLPEALAVAPSARLTPLAVEELLDDDGVLDELEDELLEPTDELLLEEGGLIELLDELLDDGLPQLVATDAASFSPLPGPAVARVMHFARMPGYAM